MCENHDSAPPASPRRTSAVARSGSLQLTALDGNQAAAYVAHPAAPSGVGVVVIPAMRGLLPFYEDLTGELAQAGLDAIAVDLYGRTAGASPRDETFDFATHYELVREPGAVAGTDADVAAAVDYLHAPAGGAVSAVFSLGFCYGGSMSWRQSAVNPHVRGCIGFYGRPAYVQHLVPEMRAPLLLLVAGDDRFIERSEVNGFLDELAAVGVDARSKVYEGAPHSFFDRQYDSYEAECADAWLEVLAFVDEFAVSE
jgi:carboxymethylenebutenolidase